MIEMPLIRLLKEMNKYNVILDCDPGHDDAIAILLLGSSDIFNCLGVTTVRGNQTIEKTTLNALNLIQYLNLPFKVYQGRSEPLFRKSPTCSQIHGDSGLDGFIFPPLKREKEELNGVLGTLTEREEKVLRLRFGLDDGQCRTLEEVGQIFGVTRERIRRIKWCIIHH